MKQPHLYGRKSQNRYTVERIPAIDPAFLQKLKGKIQQPPLMQLEPDPYTLDISPDGYPTIPGPICVTGGGFVKPTMEMKCDLHITAGHVIWGLTYQIKALPGWY